MAKIAVFDMSRKQVSERELADEVFNADVKEYLLHDMVRYQLAARRQGTAKAKGRGEVRGGGKKPYRQKGTGRARQGSRSAPHYAGGGAVFGPHPRSYEQRLPRKMKRLALRGALTAKLADDAIRVMNDLGPDAFRTRDLVASLEALGGGDGKGRRVLLVAPGRDETLELSARNLPRVEVLQADSLNVVDLLKADLVLIEEPAIRRMEEVYA